MRCRSKARRAWRWGGSSHSLKSHISPFDSQGLFMKCYFDEQTCRQKVFKSATSATPNARTWSQQTRSLRSLQSSPGRYVMNLGTFPLPWDLSLFVYAAHTVRPSPALFHALKSCLMCLIVIYTFYFLFYFFISRGNNDRNNKLHTLRLHSDFFLAFTCCRKHWNNFIIETKLKVVAVC